MGTLAELSASWEDSTRRSLTLLSQGPPKVVQPMPAFATRSRIPLLAMVTPPLDSISRAPKGPHLQHLINNRARFALVLCLGSDQEKPIDPLALCEVVRRRAQLQPELSPKGQPLKIRHCGRLRPPIPRARLRSNADGQPLSH